MKVLTQTNVTGLEGRDGVLEAIHWRQKSTEARTPIQHLFLFIGADPNTDWLSGSGIALDAKGFVLTGGDCKETRNLLETTPPIIPLDAIKAATTNADTPQTPEHRCPCCDRRMLVIERFERGATPHYRASVPTPVIRIDTS